MTGPVVVGVDLSLRSTGIATDTGEVTVVSAPEADGMGRIDLISSHVLAESWKAQFVVIEGYSYGSTTSHVRAIAELGGVVRWRLLRGGIPFMELPPKTLKKFATGSGNANKVDVIIEARERLGYTGSNDNAADARWLAAAGADLLATNPPLQLPKARRAALDAYRDHPVVAFVRRAIEGDQ